MKNIFLICLFISIFLIDTVAFASTTTTSSIFPAAPGSLSACTKTRFAFRSEKQKSYVVIAIDAYATGSVTNPSSAIKSSLLINPLNKDQLGGNIPLSSLNIYYSLGLMAPKGV